MVHRENPPKVIRGPLSSYCVRKTPVIHCRNMHEPFHGAGSPCEALGERIIDLRPFPAAVSQVSDF